MQVTISKDDTVMEREIRRQLKRELSRFFVSLVSIDSLESYVLIAIKYCFQQLRSAIEQSTSDSDKEKLQERLAKFSCGVAVLKVKNYHPCQMM